MTAILKVDTIQDTSGNNIINESSDTITIGASGDTISIPSGATLAAPGHIIQVSSQVRNTSQQTIATTTYTDLTSLSIAITPSSTSSRILLKCFVHGVIATTEGFGLQFLRDSTSIVKTGNTNAFFAAHQNGATDVLQIVPFHFIDSPSTTSEITYKVQAATRNGDAVVFNDGYHSNFYLMEIAG